MRVAVLGTGEVGRALAGALAGAGHDVGLGSRTSGNPLWLALNARLGTASFNFGVHHWGLRRGVCVASAAGCFR